MRRFSKGQVRVLTKEKVTDENWNSYVEPKIKSIIDYCNDNKLGIMVALSEEYGLYFNFHFKSHTRELCRKHLRTVKGMFKEQFNCKTSDVMILEGDNIW